MGKSAVITWLGHSCFRINFNGYHVVIDPYKANSVPGLKLAQQSANAVYCSHEHSDHSDREAVLLISEKHPIPYQISTVQTAHDAVGGAERGMNLIHIFDYDGLRIAHFGDIGSPLTADQLKKLGRVDIAMIPIGGHFTIDAKQACELADLLKPIVFIPMHYRSDHFGYGAIGTLDDFLAICPNAVHYNSNTITVSREMPKQTAILQYEEPQN